MDWPNLMQHPPSFKRFLHYPVTGGIALLALVASCTLWYSKVDVSPLEMSYWLWHGQPWRFVTSTLLHVNPFHFFFDVYMMLTFGAIVEEAFASLFLLGLMLLLAVGSMAAEWAFAAGGVGLSGVVYGLFAFLWVLGRYSRRFEGVIDKTTAWVMTGWFFVCIYLTATNIMAIANVAHGVGALLGGLAGYMVAFRGARRYAAGAGFGVTLALAVVCSSPILRPIVNFSSEAGASEFKLGYEASKAGHDEEALKYFQLALDYRHPDPVYWYDLGVSYEHLNHIDRALDAYRHALALQPDSDNYKNAVQRMVVRQRLHLTSATAPSA
jgi:membrane associated rhomboid family serine protease